MARAITEFVDIYPTLADLCGLPAPAHLRGKSLQPILEDPARAGKPAAFTVSHARGKWKGRRGRRVLGYTVRTDRYRYTEWGETAELGVELYDHENDPDEYTNLARRPGHEEALKRLRELLAGRKKTSR